MVVKKRFNYEDKKERKMCFFLTLTKESGAFEKRNMYMYMSCSQIVKTLRSRTTKNEFQSTKKAT